MIETFSYEAMATMSSSANVNCFDLSNMIDELCRRYAQFCLMFTFKLLIPTHFLKLLMLGKVNVMIQTLKFILKFADITKVFITLFWTLLSHVSG